MSCTLQSIYVDAEDGGKQTFMKEVSNAKRAISYLSQHQSAARVSSLTLEINLRISLSKSSRLV